jgi:hypothetical protein
MLELARLIGTPQKKIVLQTRAGRNIANSQSCEPGEIIHINYNRLSRQHPGWRRRKPACGIYNCFGLIWASRRTSIYDENEITKILIDDGYHRLDDETKLLPGDIVIYLSRTDRERDTLHAAVILAMEMIGTAAIPFVISKWSDAYGEDIHALRDLPTGDHYRDCIIEFWTDRFIEAD